MTLAISTCLDSLRGCADQARRCAEPYVTTQVTIRVQRWTEGSLGAGSRIKADTVLPKRFPVRELNQREVSSSAGKYTSGDVIVEMISPPYTSHGGGGFSVDQLDPAGLTSTPNKDIEALYILEGDLSGVYTLVGLGTGDPTEWSMVLRRTRLSP